MKGYVGLVGAYERDNFGDILLGRIAERAVGKEKAIYLAPFPGQADSIVGSTVHAYPEYLERHSVDAFWCVGGEIGGATIEQAMYMMHDRTDLSTAHVESPYIPRPSAYISNPVAPLIVTSAGFANLGGLGVSETATLLYTLKEASFVSVRDPKSVANLEAMGIQAIQTPDLAHSLPNIRTSARRDGAVVIQLNTATLTPKTISEIAKVILDVDSFKGTPIILFAAGTAPGHDDLDLLARLQELLTRNSSRTVTLSSLRDPYDIVDLISSARMVIATSLHCRIVACAYGVPRISLSNDKVSNYCESWDSDYPYNIHISELPKALTSLGDSCRDEPGKALAREAQELIDTVASSLTDGHAEISVLDRARNARDLYRSQMRIAQEVRERSRDAEDGVIPLRAAILGQLRRASRRRQVNSLYGKNFK